MSLSIPFLWAMTQRQNPSDGQEAQQSDMGIELASFLDLHYSSPVEYSLATGTLEDLIHKHAGDFHVFESSCNLAFTADCRCVKRRDSRSLNYAAPGEPGGHIGSTAILCAASILAACFSISWIGPKDRREALVVGTVWVALTAAFEFLAGHYVFGNSWERLIADYNVFRGRIWILVLLMNLLAPLWAFLQKQPV